MIITGIDNTKSEVSTTKLAGLYGCAACGLMIVYFLVINALGLQGYEAARFGSHAFTVLAVFFAVRTYKAHSPRPAPYMAGLGLGFLVGLFGSTLYAAFIFVYALVLNPAYQAELSSQTYFSTTVDPYLICGALVLMGLILGCLTAFILMMSEDTDAQSTFEATMNNSD